MTMARMRRGLLWNLPLAVVLAALTGGAGGAAASDDACREWTVEHHFWKVETLRRYLGGAAQSELDTALFELLQREAYLSSCPASVRTSRDELVGWRLVGRLPDEYAGAVVESLLEQSGFDLTLSDVRYATNTPEPRWTAARDADVAR